MKSVIKKIGDGVFAAEGSVVRLGTRQISFLKHQAALSARKRARICTHRSNEDAVHEMLIAISAESYIHPHRHPGKAESFHIVEGSVDVVVFDEAGNIIDVVELGDLSTGRNFYYRISENLFHTILIHTDFLVVHEVTAGPFRANETIQASFAPPESAVDDACAYIEGVKQLVAARNYGRGKKSNTLP